MSVDQADTGPATTPATTAPGAAAPEPAPPDTAGARRIIALLRDDDIDAAIDTGLARFAPLPALDDEDNNLLAQARDHLLTAWAARGRYRARAQRLERMADARRRARSTRPSASAATPGAATEAGPADPAATPRPALPAAAAAALARARARAAGRRP